MRTKIKLVAMSADAGDTSLKVVRRRLATAIEPRRVLIGHGRHVQPWPRAVEGTMREKLTKAQRELLNQVGHRRTQRVARNYSTARCLRDAGLITIEEVEPPYGWLIAITDAGRAALASAAQSRTEGEGT